jgi:hypothetical protein
MIKIWVGTVGWGTGSSQCVDFDTTVDLIFGWYILDTFYFYTYFLVLRKRVEWIDDRRRVFFNIFWFLVDDYWSYVFFSIFTSWMDVIQLGHFWVMEVQLWFFIQEEWLAEFWYFWRENYASFKGWGTGEACKVPLSDFPKFINFSKKNVFQKVNLLGFFVRR